MSERTALPLSKAWRTFDTRADGTIDARADVPAPVRETFAQLARQAFVRGRRAELVEIDPAALASLLDEASRGDTAVSLDTRIQPRGVIASQLAARRCGLEGAVPWAGVAAFASPQAEKAEARGLAVFALAGERLFATFDLPQSIVHLRPLGGRYHAIFVVDPEGLPRRPHPAAQRFRRADDPVGPRRKPGGSRGPEEPVARDACGRVLIDVAVAFTADSVDALASLDASAGNAGLDAFAGWLIARANAQFDASGIGVHLRLAAAIPTSLRESAFASVDDTPEQRGSALMRLTDGRLTPLLDAWSKTGAQSLVLVGELGGHTGALSFGGSTFAAWTPVLEDRLWRVFDDPPDAPGYRGYSIVNRVAGELYSSFTHEIGHQLGLQHERGRAYGGAVKVVRRRPFGVEDIARGYVHPAPRRLTIMAVGDGAPDRERRVPVFSRTAPYPSQASPLPGVGRWGDADADNVGLANQLAEHFARRRPPAP